MGESTPGTTVPGGQRRRTRAVAGHGTGLPPSAQEPVSVLLGPPLSGGDARDLAAAYPWPGPGPWLRGMMVASLDGASVGADGLSRSISSTVDRVVLDAVRRHCDAVLIGAGTFRAERYGPQRPLEEVRREREALGLGPAPRLVVVSRSLDLPWSERAFTESALPVLVVTSRSCDPRALATAREHADVEVLPGGRVGAADLVASLHARGLARIVCEGGPHLLSEIAGAGALDELDLAVSPLMVGGGQIAVGAPDGPPLRFRLVQVLTAGGFLFTRYLRHDPGPSPSEGAS